MDTEHLDQELLETATIKWREECLLKAGMHDQLIAHEVATHGEVDLHEAVALVKHGCPDELLLPILL